MIRQIETVAADNLPKEVIAGTKPGIDNETKEEEKEVKDISGIEYKEKENKPKVIDDQIEGITNIDTDDAGNPKPKRPAESIDTQCSEFNSVMDGHVCVILEMLSHLKTSNRE